MKTMNAVCATAVLAGLAAGARADEVTYWNSVLLDSVRATSMAPPRASRAMAMVQGAVYDAVNAVDRTHRPLRADLLAPAGTSREAAAACAAHRVMVQLFPSRQAELDSLLANRLALIPAGPARDNGLAVGDAAASAMISWRSGDGSAHTPAPWTGNADIGQWRPTANGLPGALPHWGSVTPFVIQNGSQFRAPAAPALGSAEYAAAYNEVKTLGAADSPVRTAEQTDIAHFWAANAGTVTPPGMWNQIAQVIGAQRGNTISENARMFAMVGVAVADAAITSWDTKYTHNFWRPETGIRMGEFDGAALTEGDASWRPLLVTPNHPSLTSGHSTFSSAAAAALAAFLGTDSFAFTLTSEGITRSFTSLSGAAAEAGQSRIYGGIHWQFDNQHGLAAGASVGRYVADNAFQVVPAPGVLGLAGLAGLMALRRRR